MVEHLDYQMVEGLQTRHYARPKNTDREREKGQDERIASNKGTGSVIAYKLRVVLLVVLSRKGTGRRHAAGAVSTWTSIERLGKSHPLRSMESRFVVFKRSYYSKISNKTAPLRSGPVFGNARCTLNRDWREQKTRHI